MIANPLKMLTIKTIQAGKEIFFRVKKLEMEDSVFNIVLPAKKHAHIWFHKNGNIHKTLFTVDIFEKYIYLAAARKEKTLGIISFQYFLKWFAMYYHIFIVFEEDLC